ncbi:hypothetical protein [Burkholderia anthina]|uniref:hypothetical protein n=1 Tax=Burkholderia anthina TaxID=179879 RepID=UPI000B30811F|nr:hypothetical protein [Burkholderia anthina]
MTTNTHCAALTDTIMEQAQVYASAWSLIDGPFDHGNALANAEREKAELRTLIGDTIAPFVARQTGPADLQGLRNAILTPREIMRDRDGRLTHPAIPALDEDVNYLTFLSAFGIESTFVCMETDVDADAYDQYVESNDPNCSFWTPSAPAGDGWLLLEIYDTEDGPVALYVREKKRESMRERLKREDQEARAAAPAPADERAAFEAYVECRQCDECSHVGINDSHPTDAACGHSCGWTGPSPAEDKCPGCGQENVMSVACPKCSGRYSLLAGETVRASSANKAGAPIGWAWISPTGHVSRFTADFDGKHDQLVQGWKVRPVAFCDLTANETGAERADEPYMVMLDVRDLFAYLRAAWREGQHYDREDIPDQADSWSAASDYANKTIERWTSMHPVTVRSPAMAAEAVPRKAGYVIVPVEPTDEMVTAGIAKGDSDFYGDALVRAEVRSDYQAMLAAAPHPAKADALPEIDPPQAGGNKDRLPALARTREGGNLYSLGYNRGLKKGRDEAAQADARVGLTDELVDTLKLAIGYIGSSIREDRQEHIARIRALLQGEDRAK